MYGRRNKNAGVPALAPVLALAVSTVLGCPVAPAQAPAADRGSDNVMGELAKTYSEVANALREQDGARAAEVAERLVELSRRIEPWPGKVEPGSADGVRRQAAALTAAAGDLLDAIRGEGLPAAGRQALAVRATCIGCHVRYRAGNDERRPFPATGATVWGQVTVKDRDGRRRPSAADVVVFIDAVDKPVEPPFPVTPPRVSQKGKQFTPRVLPVVKDELVEFPNDDNIFHNVFSLSKTKAFDLGIYKKGTSRSVRFPKTGLVRVYCNMHAAMNCTILVLQNGHFAVTAEDGFFCIPDLPAGNHTLRAWYLLGDGKPSELEVSGEEVVRVDFEITETRRVRPHRNKFGKRYPSRY